ncbi:hypothetical protein [Nonomuraea africana]|uniref:hypothetical protein n=1 Tax=Nonomuraea africana TaxID=46171 RepID=UPI0033F60090
MYVLWRFGELAARAEDQAAAITALYDEIRQGDHAVRRTGFGLVRLAARPADAGVVPWGVCPEHGNTLTSTGGLTRCHARRV